LIYCNYYILIICDVRRNSFSSLHGWFGVPAHRQLTISSCRHCAKARDVARSSSSNNSAR